MSFELDEIHRNVSNEELVADLNRASRQLGKNKITFREYGKIGKYHPSTLSSRFGSWNNALAIAGLETTLNRNVPDVLLFENIVVVWGKLGRQPKFRDLSNDISQYSAATYSNRFGGWMNALREFAAWANLENVEAPPHASEETRVAKTPRNVNWKLRALILIRDGAKCRLCGASPNEGAKLHVDHIHPWSKGGQTVLDNLQILCEVCNIGKSDSIEFCQSA